MLVYICFPVISPFSAHFYPPLHHNGNGSIEHDLSIVPCNRDRQAESTAKGQSWRIPTTDSIL